MIKKLLIILLALISLSAYGQKADLRKGNRQFRKEQYGEADISYRRALLQDSTLAATRYNLANTQYRQQNMEEAARQLDAVDKDAVGMTPLGADYYFNRGDVAIAQGDWKTAVESFTASLLLRPDDLQAKENYIFARNKYLEQQAQNQQNQDQQNQDKNQDQSQDQNQDQQNPQDQNQDQQQDQQKQNQDQNKDQEDQKRDSQQKQAAAELSPQQAQQLLQAIQDKEKKTQEKVDAKKAEAVKSRQKEKNW